MQNMKENEDLMIDVDKLIIDGANISNMTTLYLHNVQYYYNFRMISNISYTS